MFDDQKSTDPLYKIGLKSITDVEAEGVFEDGELKGSQERYIS